MFILKFGTLPAALDVLGIEDAVELGMDDDVELGKDVLVELIPVLIELSIPVAFAFLPVNLLSKFNAPFIVFINDLSGKVASFIAFCTIFGKPLNAFLAIFIAALKTFPTNSAYKLNGAKIIRPIALNISAI